MKNVPGGVPTGVSVLPDAGVELEIAMLVIDGDGADGMSLPQPIANSASEAIAIGGTQPASSRDRTIGSSLLPSPESAKLGRIHYLLVYGYHRLSGSWTLRGGRMALCTLLIAGCRSSPSQLPVSDRPISFVDSKSGVPIERVLVIPKYSSSIGVSTGAGHGPGAMAQSQFVAFPFVYQSGDRFRPRQPDSSGLLEANGALFVGKGISINGAVVIARRHRPVWLWRLWQRKNNDLITLDPIGEKEDTDLRHRLEVLLSNSSIQAADVSQSESDFFALAQNGNIGVRFDKADRLAVRDFLR